MMRDIHSFVPRFDGHYKALCACIIIGLSLCVSQLKSTDIQDLPNFTPSFSLRSAFNGVVLLVDRNQPNWDLREINDEKQIATLAQNDPFASFNLGYVQFLSPDNTQKCMAIDTNGQFVLKSCQEDLDKDERETIFSLIPTSTSAVQIRSMVLGANECIGVIDTPSGSIFGLKPCDVKSLTFIDLRNLMLILPFFESADLINP